MAIGHMKLEARCTRSSCYPPYASCSISYRPGDSSKCLTCHCPADHSFVPF